MSSTLRDLALGQADEVEELGALGLAAVRARQALMKCEELVGLVPPREAEELREIAERGACGRRPRRGARDLGRAGARAHEPAGDLHEGGLAGAVRAEEPDELSLADLEVDAAERGHVPVALRETLCAERGHAASLRTTFRGAPRQSSR